MKKLVEKIGLTNIILIILGCIMVIGFSIQISTNKKNEDYLRDSWVTSKVGLDVAIQNLEISKGSEDELMGVYVTIPVDMIERLEELSVNKCPSCGPSPNKGSYSIFFWENPDGEMWISIIDSQGNKVSWKSCQAGIYDTSVDKLPTSFYSEGHFNPERGCWD